MLFTYVNTGAAPFSPADVANLALWLDASDTTTISQVAGLVTQWNDKSGNSYNVTQGTGANQPQTGIESINGNNVISFDGVNDFLTSSDTGLLSLVNGDYSIYLVAQPRVSDAAGPLFHFGEQFGSSNNGVYYRYDFSNTVLQACAAAGDNNNFSYTASTTPSTGRLIKSGSTAQVYRNAQTGSSFAAANYAAAFRFNIAGFSDPSAARTNINFAEMLIYTGVHDAPTQALILSYFTTKWGTP